MSKINIVILGAMAVLLSGCGQPSIPVKDEQTKGVYKIYYPNYFMYDAKMLNTLLDVWCENDACRQNYKNRYENKLGEVTYIHIIDGKKCKIIDGTIKDNEATEILRLEQEKARNCIFRRDELIHDRYYKSGVATMGFKRNGNGDFINSEFLTLQDGKVVDRKWIEDTKTIMFYNKNGSKLLDKVHQNIYFYPKTCDKVLAVDGLKYEILPINAKKGYIAPPKTTTIIDKDREKLLKTKFYLDNQNSSKIKIFAPFGYMMDYGTNFIGEEKHKRKVQVYRLYDENGKELFEGVDLIGAIKINDHRLIVFSISPLTSELKASLYDFDNKKVLLAADRIKPDYISSTTKYDKIVFFKDKKTGIADFDGNTVMDLQNKYMFENTYRGFITYADKTGIYRRGVLDTELNIVIKELSKVDFRDDIFIAYAKDKIVIFDYSKNILQNLKADSITVYDNFYIASFKNDATLYDKQWNRLFDKSYKNLKLLDNGTFSYTLEGKTALMDINAKEIIPPICDSIKQGSCETIECTVN